MSYIKMILIGILAALGVSLLFFVVPEITDIFICSYVSVLVAIAVFTANMCVVARKDSATGYGYLNTAIKYVVVNILFAIVAYFTDMDLTWAIVVQAMAFIIYLISTIATNMGEDQVKKLSEKTEERKKFEEQKKKYWD